MTGLGGSTDIYFYSYQGLIVQPLIVSGYIIIFRKLKAYHITLINKYSRSFKPQEISELMRADKQVFVFFILICQFLIIWSCYMLTQIISRLTGGITTPWPQRMIDIFSIILSISSMIMMYGISDSIKKALATQIRQEKIESASHLSGLVDSELDETSVSHRIPL